MKITGPGQYEEQFQDLLCVLWLKAKSKTAQIISGCW